jgi:hypothetical protein
VIFRAGIEDENMIKVLSDELLVVLIPRRDVTANGEVWIFTLFSTMTLDEVFDGTHMMSCIRKGDSVFDLAKDVDSDVGLMIPEEPCLEGLSATKVKDGSVLGDDL